MGNFVLECSPWGYLYKLQQFNFHEPLAAWLHEIQKEINLKKQIIRIWLFDILFITMQNILTTIINLSKCAHQESEKIFLWIWFSGCQFRFLYTLGNFVTIGVKLDDWEDPWKTLFNLFFPPFEWPFWAHEGPRRYPD